MQLEFNARAPGRKDANRIAIVKSQLELHSMVTQLLFRNSPEQSSVPWRLGVLALTTTASFGLKPGDNESGQNGAHFLRYAPRCLSVPSSVVKEHVRE